MTNQIFIQDPEIIQAMSDLEIPPATIVSLVPLPISEKKPGLYPGQFDIPGADDDDVEVLVVGISKHYTYLDSDRGSITQENPPAKVARSIVNDYIQDSLMVDESAHPGLFYVMGKHTKEEVKEKFPEKIKEARDKQYEWFKRLVVAADDMWAKDRRHVAITNMQRVAARVLGLDKEWKAIPKPDVNAPVMQKCPACFAVTHPQQIVCAACNCILDQEAYANLQFMGKGKASAQPLGNIVPVDEQVK
jgi:hypothetical protein